MNQDAFAASLAQEGYEVAPSSGAADKVTQPHAHAYDVRALVTRGELTLTVDGASRTYGAGEVFAMPAGCMHSERHGPEGSETVVGRRPART